MAVEVTRCSCGTAAPLRIYPNETFGGSIEVITCPKCDRLSCAQCGAPDFSGRTNRCGQCGAVLETLADVYRRMGWPWE